MKHGYLNLVLFAAFTLALTGCSAMTNGKMEAVSPVNTAPRAGSVYLLRGFIGIFSTGIDHLGEEVNEAGIHGEVFQTLQWREIADTIAAKYSKVKEPEPLVLVGHSYGADDVVNIARELEKKHIKVDLIVTLDPTTPKPLPSNVRWCYNLYQSGTFDALPWARGIPLETEPNFKGKLNNINIRVDRTDLLDPDVTHFNIEKKEKIHAETLKQILTVCPPRQQWALGYKGDAITASRTQAAAPARPATRPTAGIDGAFLSGE